MLTEVEVLDDVPPDNDDESIWTDDGDNVEEATIDTEALGQLFMHLKPEAHTVRLCLNDMCVWV